MIKTDSVIIVEGKYDKIKLSNIIDGIIITTDGFGIFRDREKQAFIRKLAMTKGITIVTDSDSAGFRIRNYIRSIAKDGKITNVYIPDIPGKEKRKAEPSKEGKLGVEGIDEKLILEAFAKAGAVSSVCEKKEGKKVTTADLYEDCITGHDDSRERRYALLEHLGLPKRLSVTSMLEIINTFMTFEEYKTAVGEISTD